MLEAFHPVKRAMRKVGRGFRWLLDLPNMKLYFFLAFAIIFSIVPVEFYQNRSVLLFFIIVVPFIIYVIYLGYSTSSDADDEYALKNKKDDDEEGEDDD